VMQTMRGISASRASMMAAAAPEYQRLDCQQKATILRPTNKVLFTLCDKKSVDIISSLNAEKLFVIQTALWILIRVRLDPDSMQEPDPKLSSPDPGPDLTLDNLMKSISNWEQ
jgi:hypothetical protein